ncbi:hypothetical protein BDF19DRAFT_433852 [Syncephalis fuscata]|nr:hypothetical protein BDF19DRAFT_433852 [Syncephalis fuscata]
MALFDGSWFSAMQKLRQVLVLNKPYADIMPMSSISSSLSSSNGVDEQPRRPFDGAPGLYWPLHIPAVRSWYLYESWRLAHLSLDHLMTLEIPEHLTLDLLHASILSNKRFQRDFNATCTPALINGLALDWPAYKGAWSIDQLVEKWGDVAFRVSIEQVGPRPDRISRFHLSIHDYVHYCRHQQDASPIYIFDAGFGERTPRMLEDYKRCGSPPYRWFVMGPARASWHVDPSGTSAWNTLISGRKRWALYPNHVIPPGVKSIDTLQPINQKCIQEPGQTIFVPGGWWHMVLNLEETVAITQNFADDHNLEVVCNEVVADPKLWTIFQQTVIQHHPQLKSFMSKFNEDTETTNDPVIIKEGFLNRTAFTDSFKDLDLWRPRCETAITQLIDIDHSKQLVLPELPLVLTALSTGQNPVFNVNDQWIIKYYAHLAGGHQAYEMEERVLRECTQQNTLLNDRIPRLLAQGHLYDDSDNDKWSWPYIIYQRVNGTPLQPLIIEDKEELVDWSQVLPWLADTLAKLHVSSPNTSLPPSPPHSSSQFRQYLLALSKHCYTRHQSWRHLPPWLIDDIERYMKPFIQWLEHGIVQGRTHRYTVNRQQIDQWLSRGTSIHGDLNAANLIGETMTSSILSNSLWQITGLIDFADTKQYADPLWDFIPLHISVFGGNVSRFHAFLSQYRSRVPLHYIDCSRRKLPFMAATSSSAKHRHRVPLSLLTASTRHYPFPLEYILTCYLLLWPYEGVVRWLVSIRSELCACRRLDELSYQLWLSSA